MSIHLKARRNLLRLNLWNYTRSETHSYMMVLEYAADGNLREYLKINFNNIN